MGESSAQIKFRHFARVGVARKGTRWKLRIAHLTNNCHISNTNSFNGTCRGVFHSNTARYNYPFSFTTTYLEHFNCNITCINIHIIPLLCRALFKEWRSGSRPIPLRARHFLLNFYQSPKNITRNYKYL